MADKELKELDSIINVDGTDYKVVAAKTANTLTIKDNKTGSTVFDGSEAKTLELATINGKSITAGGNIEIAGGTGGDGGNANKIQVTLDDSNGDGNKEYEYATITISQNDPNGGNRGDIWFKYTDLKVKEEE
jgi:hypothetical protein